jgi:hypothetical protein
MTLMHVVFVLSNLCCSHLVVMTHKRLYIIANKKKVASSNWFKFNNINNLILFPPLLLVYLSFIVIFHLYLKYLCVLCFNETKKQTRNFNEAMQCNVIMPSHSLLWLNTFTPLFFLPLWFQGHVYYNCITPPPAPPPHVTFKRCNTVNFFSQVSKF